MYTNIDYTERRRAPLPNYSVYWRITKNDQGAGENKSALSKMLKLGMSTSVQDQYLLSLDIELAWRQLSKFRYFELSQ